MPVWLPMPQLKGEPARGSYKPSRYNLLFEDADGSWLFNTRRGSFLRFPHIAADNLSFLAEIGQVYVPEAEPEPLPELPAALLAELVAGEFVIPGDLNELKALEVANRSARFGMDSLNLTILTTLGCNLDCFYCYEDKHHGVMQADVQDRVMRFVDHQAPTLSTFGVTWFGGEPLLGLRVIERLSAHFLKACAEHQIGYGADIITNGVLLTRSTAERLAALGVTSAQITLDGPPAVHDSRRPKVHGGESFATILANIEETCDVINTTIRVNLDRENADDAPRLVDLLAGRGLQRKIQLSFAPVHADGKGCRDRGDTANPNLFKLKEIANLQIALNKYASEQGFPFGNYPLSRTHSCCADQAQSFVIEPDGTLQKCWQTVSDPAQSIGDVFSGPRMNDNLLKWLTYDPFAPGFKCRTCKVLPTCMGWCPEKIMKDPSPESCNYIKHTIIEDLKLYYQNHHAGSRLGQPVPASEARVTPEMARD